MTRTLLIMIFGEKDLPSTSTMTVLCAISDMPVRPSNRGSNSSLSCLALDAYAKAEHARQRWQAARLAGDTQAAERARRLMLRHQAIAYHLDPNRGLKHESV